MAAVVVGALLKEASVVPPQTQSSGPAQPAAGEEVCSSRGEYLGFDSIFKYMHLYSLLVHV